MTEEKQKTESNASPTIGSGIHPATVTWLIKGTLAVVTVVRRDATRPSVVEGFPPPGAVVMAAQYLMGPDGHEVMGTYAPDDHLSANVWRFWVEHPDTIREAREAWLAAGGKL